MWSLWLVLIATLVGSIVAALRLSIVNATRSGLEELLIRSGAGSLLGSGSGSSSTSSGTNGSSNNGASGGSNGGAGSNSESSSTTYTTPAAERIRAILDDVAGHGRAVALPRIVCNVLVVAGVFIWFFGLEAAPGREIDETTGVAITLGRALAASAISAAWLWWFLVVIPTSLADHAADRIVFTFARVARMLYVAEKPIRPALRFMDEVVRRLSGAEKRNPHDELEAELLSVIEEGEREGRIDEHEREMIEAVVELRETTVEQIMTPRTEIEALEATDSLAEIVDFLERVGHSRIPVYERDLDHIAGILYAKDLLPWLKDRNRTFTLAEVLRPAVFVPESKTVKELLAQLLVQKVHIAMVADEYGGTAGLVTFEDIVEEIFGEIQDEYDPAEESEPEVIVEESQRAAEVDARAYVDDVNDAIEPLGVSIPESDEYDTLGGFVVTTLGRIPEAGETVRTGAALLTVLEATPTRVVRVKVEVTDDSSPEETQHDDEDHHEDELPSGPEPAARSADPDPGDTSRGESAA